MHDEWWKPLSFDALTYRPVDVRYSDGTRRVGMLEPGAGRLYVDGRPVFEDDGHGRMRFACGVETATALTVTDYRRGVRDAVTAHVHYRQAIDDLDRFMADLTQAVGYERPGEAKKERLQDTWKHAYLAVGGLKQTVKAMRNGDWRG